MVVFSVHEKRIKYMFPRKYYEIFMQTVSLISELISFRYYIFRPK